jgi:hypothetical protein
MEAVAEGTAQSSVSLDPLRLAPRDVRWIALSRKTGAAGSALDRCQDQTLTAGFGRELSVVASRFAKEVVAGAIDFTTDTHVSGDHEDFLDAVVVMLREPTAGAHSNERRHGASIAIDPENPATHPAADVFPLRGVCAPDVNLRLAADAVQEALLDVRRGGDRRDALQEAIDDDMPLFLQRRDIGIARGCGVERPLLLDRQCTRGPQVAECESLRFPPGC